MKVIAKTATVMIDSTALDALAGAWTRHMLFDAEGAGSQWLVAMRGEDRSRKGGESKVAPALKWNGEDGTARRMALATVEGNGAQERAEGLVAGLRAFYAAEGTPFSERVAGLDADTIALCLMVATVGQNGANAHANAASHWRVGSCNETREAKRVERAKRDNASAVAVMTSAANDPAQLNEIAASVETPEQLAALEAIFAASKARLAAAK